jgi:ADP-heptose:LPS heptosyltransferase
VPPPDASARAAALISGAPRPLVGLHASGGRESKQWHLDRFAAVGRRLAHDRGATIVLTGSPSDRPLVDRVRAELGDVRVVDAAGVLDLPALAALVGALDLFVTGDTGPMHLAAAMDTPVVALFGPSHVERYGPLAARRRILRVDLYCSPCGRVRLPPERCRGHVPDCMDGIQVDAVVAAALELLPA